MKRTVALTIFGTLVAGLGVGLVIRQRPAKPPSKDEKKVAALTNEVHKLRRDLALTQLQAAQTMANRSLSATHPASAPPDAAPLVTLEEKKARRRTQLARWYAGLDSQFFSEAPDPSWSAGTTKLMEAVVAKHKDSATPLSTSCAKTMCRIAVNHPDQDKQRDFAAQMGDEDLLGTEAAFKYDAEATPPTTTVWVARPGHKIPRH